MVVALIIVAIKGLGSNVTFDEVVRATLTPSSIEIVTVVDVAVIAELEAILYQ